MLISLSVILITGLNLLSAGRIGKAENWIVALKVAILLMFVGVGFAGIKTAQIEPPSWSPPLQLAAGGMIIFLAYEGFELIANTAQDVRNVARTLPRAYFTAVGFVIALDVRVALVTVGNVSVEKIVEEDFAFGVAAVGPSNLAASKEWLSFTDCRCSRGGRVLAEHPVRESPETGTACVTGW